MEIRQIKTFVVISKLNSFTQAADALGYAQSSVTTQIQLLEDELGTRLFERLGRSICLTSAGEKFLPYAKQILNLCTEAKNIVSTSDIPSGVLNIGTFESLCVTRLPELYKKYHERYPNVEVNLKISDCQNFKNLLYENVVDVAFFLEKRIYNPYLISYVEIFEPMVLLTTPEHTLASKKFVYPEDLYDENLILTEKECSYRIALESVLSDSQVKPRSISESGSIQVIKQLVLSGLGITFLPRMAVEKELKENRLVALNWKGTEFDLMIQLIHHKDKWISPALKAFLEVAKEVLK